MNFAQHCNALSASISENVRIHNRPGLDSADPTATPSGSMKRSFSTTSIGSELVAYEDCQNLNDRSP